MENFFQILLEPFTIRALIAGIGIAIVAGVMGCFVVWRRMAYFGDSLAHSSLLGIALGLAAGISTDITIIVVCTIFALLLVWLQQKNVLTNDTLLGILAHCALSIGMVTISLIDKKIDLHAYLFGDILTVTKKEIIWIYIGSMAIIFFLILNWSALVLSTINEDLAMAENIKTFLLKVIFMFLMTIVVAISIRIVGILLITSLLIIPAASSRQIARSPEAMAIISSVIGAIAIIFGICNSILLDTPSGPSIVTSLAIIFILILPIGKIFRIK